MTIAPHRRSPTPTHPDDRDADALRRIANGETGALGGLYERHHAVVYRFVARATNHGHDVEDLVHATFLTAVRAAESFDGRESSRPWLLGIAARLLQRRRRTLARWSRTLRELAIRVAEASTDPHRNLEARGELNALATALAGLTESKRIVLLLAEVEGLSAEEIATALDVPIGTVWARLHHARRELREHASRKKHP